MIASGVAMESMVCHHGIGMAEADFKVAVVCYHDAASIHINA